MRFELFVALRYLTATRKQTMVSVVSVIAVAGVLVGVMALIVALALMTGFSSDIQGKILGAEAHVFVVGDDIEGGITDWQQLSRDLGSIAHVTGVAPNVLDGGVLSGPYAQEPASLRGVLPPLEAEVTSLADHMVLGTLPDLTPYEPETRSGIILGKDLAFAIGASVGDRVDYMSLSRPTLSPVGAIPRRRVFRVVGVFETGHFEYDRTWALVHISTAERLLGLDGAVSRVKLKVDDLENISAVTDAARQRVGGRYPVYDLLTLNRPLFSAFKLEKILMGITIGLIVLVAALNIVTTLTMMVMEKTRDIGILQAMGCTAPRITRVFMLQGLIIGLIGTGSGLGLGVLLCWLLDHYQLITLDTRVYYIPYLPFEVRPWDVGAIGVMAVLVSFVATIYPSWRAARLDTVEALRHE